MMQGIAPPVFPQALADDDDDVTWALHTAAVQWKRGAHGDAIGWLERAVEAAVDNGRAIRAREIQQQANSLSAALKAGWSPNALPVPSGPASVWPPPGGRAPPSVRPPPPPQPPPPIGPAGFGSGVPRSGFSNLKPPPPPPRPYAARFAESAEPPASVRVPPSAPSPPKRSSGTLAAPSNVPPSSERGAGSAKPPPLSNRSPASVPPPSAPPALGARLSTGRALPLPPFSPSGRNASTSSSSLRAAEHAVPASTRGTPIRNSSSRYSLTAPPASTPYGSPPRAGSAGTQSSTEPISEPTTAPAKAPNARRSVAPPAVDGLPPFHPGHRSRSAAPEADDDGAEPIDLDVYGEVAVDIDFESEPNAAGSPSRRPVYGGSAPMTVDDADIIEEFEDDEQFEEDEPQEIREPAPGTLKGVRRAPPSAPDVEAGPELESEYIEAEEDHEDGEDEDRPTLPPSSRSGFAPSVRPFASEHDTATTRIEPAPNYEPSSHPSRSLVLVAEEEDESTDAHAGIPSESGEPAAPDMALSEEEPTERQVEPKEGTSQVPPSTQEPPSAAPLERRASFGAAPSLSIESTPPTSEPQPDSLVLPSETTPGVLSGAMISLLSEPPPALPSEPPILAPSERPITLPSEATGAPISEAPLSLSSDALASAREVPLASTSEVPPSFTSEAPLALPSEAPLSLPSEPALESSPPASGVPLPALTELGSAAPPSAPAASALAIAPQGPPGPPAICGILLSEVPGLEDLPDESQADLVHQAEIHTLAANEEVSGFGLALVLEGTVAIMPAVADVAAGQAKRGELVFTEGHLEDGVALRVVARRDGAQVATWQSSAFETAIQACPWVGDELKFVGDRFQALCGVTMGVMGEQLDEMLRGLVVDRCEVKQLLPGEVFVEGGKPIPGMVIVGAGRIEVVEQRGGSTKVSQALGPGEFLFPLQILQASPAPATARAGKTGALILFAERKLAHELLMSVPPLLGLFAQ